MLWKLRRVYDWDGRMAERERQARIAAETDMSAERWQEYRRNWNRLLERAAEKGDCCRPMAERDEAGEDTMCSPAENHRDMRSRREDLDVRDFPAAEAWREGVEEAVAAKASWRTAGDDATSEIYGPHLDGMERSGRGGLEYALSIVARCSATTTGTSRRPWRGQHKGEDARARESGSPVFSTIPQKLREQAHRRN